MNRVLTLVVLLFASIPSVAQDYKPLFSIPLEEGNFTTDPLGNLYIFTKGDITKYNSEGLESGRFSSRDYGDITFVDASNPLKILIVYREFSKAIVLDASLSPHATIELSFPGISFINVICTSREGGYWIIDPISRQIKKLNEQLQFTLEGTPFRQVTEKEIEPGYLVDSGNWLVMNSGKNGLLVFDRFGTYYKTIATVTEQPVQASGDEILFKENTSMIKINIKTGITDHFILPDNKPDDPGRVEGNRIFIKTQNSIKIYTY